MDDKTKKKKKLNTKQQNKLQTTTSNISSKLSTDIKKDSNVQQDLLVVEEVRDIKDAVPIMEFVKKDGKYKITMNCLTSDGRLDPLYKPIVFKLGMVKQPENLDITSSSSSINFQFIPPETIYAQNYQKTCNDVSTMYNVEDLVEKK